MRLFTYKKIAMPAIFFLRTLASVPWTNSKALTQLPPLSFINGRLDISSFSMHESLYVDSHVSKILSFEGSLLYLFLMIISRNDLELLEDIPLNSIDAWYVLLVYLNLKSGSWVQISSNVWREGDQAMHIPQSTLAVVKRSLKVLGLLYYIELRDSSAGIWQGDNGRKRLNQIADIYIAKEQEILDDIMLARKNNDSTLLGIALGYPKTAVAAFATDKKRMISDLDPKVQLSEAGQLTYFAVSKDNWENEIAEVEIWISALKANSGIMWNQLVKDTNLLDDELINLIVKSKK